MISLLFPLGVAMGPVLAGAKRNTGLQNVTIVQSAGQFSGPPPFQQPMKLESRQTAVVQGGLVPVLPTDYVLCLLHRS